jgi:hypothetical protein
VPPEQVWNPLQTLLQAPQFRGSVLTLVHLPLQYSNPVGQEQLPAEHFVPPEHRTPQPPQLSSSLFVLTQAPPQEVLSPPPQPEVVQFPALQA